jgi:hypothetical protein
MENANPPLSPSEAASLREQIKSEIRELREINRLIDIELDYALNDLAMAMDLNEELVTSQLTQILQMQIKIK